MVFQILESEDGKVLGTVTASDVYSAAREACQRLFKSQALPYRETGWAGRGGTFSVQEPDGCHGRTFFIKVPL